VAARPFPTEPVRRIPYYRDLYGFQLVHKVSGDGMDSYFMGTVEEDVSLPEPGSDDAAAFVMSGSGFRNFIEFQHTHGSESDDSFKVNNGNVEPNRGFGHLAVSVPDVDAFCAELEGKDVKFQKKPHEGRMKGLAFSLDPDGYWIEIIRRRGELPGLGKRPSYSQTMIRVSDPADAKALFEDALHMTSVGERHFPKESGDFSLFFYASLPKGTAIPPADDWDEARQYQTDSNLCVLEITHNHGTESDSSFHYHSGNTDPKGFRHVGFIVPDVAATLASLTSKGFKGAMLSDGTAEVFLPRDEYRVLLAPSA
jgi:lactoylglutathione lyase